MLHVTDHALERFRERVADLPDDQIRERLNSPTIRCAANLGAPYVRLGTGQRVVLRGTNIITILPAGYWVGSFDPAREKH